MSKPVAIVDVNVDCMTACHIHTQYSWCWPFIQNSVFVSFLLFWHNWILAAYEEYGTIGFCIVSEFQIHSAKWTRHMNLFLFSQHSLHSGSHSHCDGIETPTFYFYFLFLCPFVSCVAYHNRNETFSFCVIVNYFETDTEIPMFCSK